MLDEICNLCRSPVTLDLKPHLNILKEIVRWVPAIVKYSTRAAWATWTIQDHVESDRLACESFNTTLLLLMNDRCPPQHDLHAPRWKHTSEWIECSACWTRSLPRHDVMHHIWKQWDHAFAFEILLSYTSSWEIDNWAVPHHDLIYRFFKLISHIERCQLNIAWKLIAWRIG